MPKFCGLPKKLEYPKVTFRVLVFRPFIEEVLIGRVKSSTKEGLTLNLGFFDDIFLPASHLQHPCRFDESDQGTYLNNYVVIIYSYLIFMSVEKFNTNIQR